MDYTVKNAIEATKDARLRQVDDILDDILEDIAIRANGGNTCYSVSLSLFSIRDVKTLVTRRLNTLGFADVEWALAPDVSVWTLTVRWPDPMLIDKED